MTINTLILDCDGVLTDGKKYVSEDGERNIIAFNCRDNQAVSYLIEKGIRVIILTASPWPGIGEYWKKYGAEVYYTKDKENVAQEVKNRGQKAISWETCAGVGDDISDLGFLKKCAVAFCPDDAHPSVRHMNGIRNLVRKGGEGIVCELIYNNHL